MCDIYIYIRGRRFVARRVPGLTASPKCLFRLKALTGSVRFRCIWVVCRLFFKLPSGDRLPCAQPWVAEIGLVYSRTFISGSKLRFTATATGVCKAYRTTWVSRAPTLIAVGEHNGTEVFFFRRRRKTN